MPQEMIQTSKEHKDTKEELEILRNPEIMAAIEESRDAIKKGVKPWKLDV